MVYLLPLWTMPRPFYSCKSISGETWSSGTVHIDMMTANSRKATQFFFSGLVKTIPLSWLLVSFFFFFNLVYLHNLLQCLEFLSLQIPENCNSFSRSALKFHSSRKYVLILTEWIIASFISLTASDYWYHHKIHHAVQVLYDYSKVEHPSEIFPNLKWYKVKKQLP